VTRSSPASPTTTTTTLSSSTKKARGKRLEVSCRGFRRLVGEWLDVDDQCGTVVDSIANLRKRCSNTGANLAKAKEQQEEGDGDNFSRTGSGGSCISSSSRWKQSGYRGRNNGAGGEFASCLTVDDLELTLSDELVRHEKMVALLRRLLGQLSQQQEAMGRKLDELVSAAGSCVSSSSSHAVSYYHSGGDYNEEDGGDDDDKEEEEVYAAAAKEEECRQVFAATARELYRKQVLAQGLIFDVVAEADDSVVQVDDGAVVPSFAGLVDSGAAAARKCAQRWTRTGPRSELRDYLPFLAAIEKAHRG